MTLSRKIHCRTKFLPQVITFETRTALAKLAKLKPNMTNAEFNASYSINDGMCTMSLQV